MDIVLLLPGQGSQKVGMGRDLYDASAAAREAFDAVDAGAGAAVSALAFEGPVEELRRTHNAQPALLAHSAAVWAMVGDALAPFVRAAAGHSLGEFSAHHTAGTFELRPAAHLVRRRGQLMYETGQARPGGMCAILGTLATPIEDICVQASADAGQVVPANYNSAEQVVISGESAGVERAMRLAREAGAKRCLPLPVSGAFHSPLMQPAVSGLQQVLDGTAMHAPVHPIYANVDATEVSDVTTARERLVQQLTAPVQWVRVMQQLVARWPDALFLEMGTGAVLSGLARRIAPHVTTRSAGTLSEVETLLELVHAGEVQHAR